VICQRRLRNPNEEQRHQTLYFIDGLGVESTEEFHLYPSLKYSFSYKEVFIYWHVVKCESCPNVPSILQATSSNFPAKYYTH
jgi:hypothetical protein